VFLLLVAHGESSSAAARFVLPPPARASAPGLAQWAKPACAWPKTAFGHLPAPTFRLAPAWIPRRSAAMKDDAFAKIAKKFEFRRGFKLRTLNFRAWWLKPVLAALGSIGLTVFALTRVTYRIGPEHLQVVLLGVPVRRVRLDNIRNIHTGKILFAEKWHNTFFPGPDRLLVIEKRRGLMRFLVITPERRFVFKAQLDQAIRERLELDPVSNSTELQRPVEAEAA
jgi:hypothetical protein